MRSLILVVLATTVLTLTACGGDSTVDTTADESRSDTETPDTETPDTETPDTDPDTETPDNDPDTETPDTDTPAPVGSGPYPIADLTIVFDPGDGATVTYRLACLGDTATFTGDTSLSAVDACLALTELDTRTRLLSDAHLQDPCTMQYGGPETATISGTLDEQPVETTVDRADGCGIHAWSVTLAALVPRVG